MTRTGHLRAGDADAILRLVEDARRDDPGPALPWALLDGLQRLVTPGACVVYQVLDTRDGRFLVGQESGPGGEHELWEDDPSAPQDASDRAYFDLWWDDPLCSYPERTGDVRSVLLSTDFFPTLRAFRSRAIRQAVDPDLRSLMQIPLPSSAGIVRRVMLGTTDGPGLRERDRQLGALVRPHLEEARADAERRRDGVPGLTPREWEVLSLTAAGLSHAQVAARLYVSVSTVHKHMENVRVRLGVRSAAAAAALALPHAPHAPHASGVPHAPGRPPSTTRALAAGRR